MQRRSSVSASSPTSVVAWVVNVSHSDRYKVVSPCGFDLYFPDDEWCWAYFHVSLGHLDVFFGEASIHVFCPFLHWIIYFLDLISSLQILDTNLLSNKSFANIFSHSTSYLLILIILFCFSLSSLSPSHPLSLQFFSLKKQVTYHVQFLMVCILQIAFWWCSLICFTDPYLSYKFLIRVTVLATSKLPFGWLEDRIL